MKQVNKSIVKVSKFETLVAELAIEKKYHHVICGHTHQPAKDSLQTKKVQCNTLTAATGWNILQHWSTLKMTGIFIRIQKQK